MSDWREIDLDRVANVLRNKREYRQLVAAIELFKSIKMAQLDLKRCRAALGYLRSDILGMRNVEEDDQNSAEQLVGGALFSQAVILYALATDTSSGRRKPTGIRDKLSDEGLSTHKLIMKLRNKAIAHVGNDEEDWVVSRVVMRIGSNQSIRLLCPFERYNYRADIVEAFIPLCDEALAASRLIEGKRVDALHNHIHVLSSTDDNFRSVVDKNRFEDIGFFETQAGLRTWREVMEVEQATSREEGTVQRPSATRKPTGWRDM